jgi:hypothetical protein
MSDQRTFLLFTQAKINQASGLPGDQLPEPICPQ